MEIEMDYKYDVAFSFIQKDEQLAQQLNKLLSKTVKSFIYSEEQKRLAGKDGEMEFNQVFSKESRIVVVLYRNDWGKTPWSRIEEEAIRNRAHTYGYDFTVFIPLDKPPILPQYLPKNRLWLGLERWGIEAAASAIEERIREGGGVIKVLSLADKVRIADEEMKAKARRTHTLNQNGTQLSIEEFKKIVELVKTEVGAVKEQVKDWHIYTRDRNNGIDVISSGIQLSFQATYIPGQSHTLTIASWTGIWPPNDEPPMFNVPVLIWKEKLTFDINDLDQDGWLSQDSNKFYMTSSLVPKKLEQLIGQVQRANVNVSGRR